MDLQQLIALQKASGGQNTITPENAGRIMGLAAQQEANRQLSMDAGKLAVEERKRLQEMQQGMTPGQISGSTIVAPSGARFVTDAKGNVVGMNAPVTPLGPKPYAGESMQEARQAFNQGNATQAERDAFRANMFGDARSPGLVQKTFIQEMQKQAPAQAAVAQAEAPPVTREQLIPNIRSIYDRSGFGARAPEAPAPSAAEMEQMQTEKDLLEQRFASSGAASPEQQTEDTSRADMYRKLKELEGYLKSGSFSVAGGDTGLAIPPAARIKMENEVSDLRENIARSGKKSSGIAAKTAVPKDAMARYQAILDSLARARK